MVRTTRLISLLVHSCLCACLWASPARAAGPEHATQPVMELSYEQALTLARAQAPELAVAQARVAEAEGRVDAAGVWRDNPRVLATAGPRFGREGTTVDASVRATQWFDTGGQRGRRVDLAEAELEAREARSEDARRLILREVSLAFVTALYCQRQVEIAGEELELARAAEAVARRRHELGDVGGLEESSATLAVAQARAQLERLHAAHDQAEGRLAALLGIEAGTRLAARGDLRALALADAPIEGDLDARPDLRALEADARAAQAMGALGRSKRAPKLALGLGYAHEESEHVMFGVVGISLPIFDRGQGEVAVAEARDARVQAERAAVRNAAAHNADTAEALAQRARAAARDFEREGLAQLERSESMTTVSYEKGAIAYDELLIVRLQLAHAKRTHVELLREAARARVELAAATGALQ